MNDPAIPNTTPDYYLTIQEALRAPEFKIKGSRFIADIIPVSTKEEVEQALATIRKEFYDASHHCFAYRLGPTGMQLRAADDGEPTGTAGKPILLVLTSAKLTNTLLVVTRYFGGTKLGTGGLARAYAEAAQQAISLSKPVTIFRREQLNLIVPYDDNPHVERMVYQFEGTILEANYLDSVSMKIELRSSLAEQFRHQVIEQFGGRVAVVR